MPTHLYKTFGIRTPAKTHYRRATCAEYDCAAYKNGWQLRVESLTPDLLYLARNAGRRYTEVAVREGETLLVFEAGQSCFAETTHQIPLDRPEFYFVGRGDYRSFSTRKAQQLPPGDWVEQFATHIDTLHTAIQRG